MFKYTGMFTKQWIRQLKGNTSESKQYNTAIPKHLSDGFMCYVTGRLDANRSG